MVQYNILMDFVLMWKTTTAPSFGHVTVRQKMLSSWFHMIIQHITWLLGNVFCQKRMLCRKLIATYVIPHHASMPSNTWNSDDLIIISTQTQNGCAWRQLLQTNDISLLKRNNLTLMQICNNQNILWWPWFHFLF